MSSIWSYRNIGEAGITGSQSIACWGENKSISEQNTIKSWI